MRQLEFTSLRVKTCTACQRTLPVEKFDRSKNTKDGRIGRCKMCRYLYRKENETEEQLAKKAARDKAYYSTPRGRELTKARCKRWRDKKKKGAAK